MLRHLHEPGRRGRSDPQVVQVARAACRSGTVPGPRPRRWRVTTRMTGLANRRLFRETLESLAAGDTAYPASRSCRSTSTASSRSTTYMAMRPVTPSCVWSPIACADPRTPAASGRASAATSSRCCSIMVAIREAVGPARPADHRRSCRSRSRGRRAVWRSAPRRDRRRRRGEPQPRNRCCTRPMSRCTRASGTAAAPSGSSTWTWATP